MMYAYQIEFKNKESNKEEIGEYFQRFMDRNSVEEKRD